MNDIARKDSHALARLNKLWQIEKQAIELQLEVKQGQKWHKLYLRIDLVANKPNITLRTQRSELGVSKGVIAEQWRRLRPRALLGIYQTPDKKTLMLRVGGQGQIAFLLARAVRPNTVSIIVNDTVVGSMSTKGSYTKKHDATELLGAITADDQLQEISTTVLSSLGSFEETQLPRNDTVDSPKVSKPDFDRLPPENIDSEVNDIAKRIRRRLKTISKSVIKLEQQIPTQEELARQAELTQKFHQNIALIKIDSIKEILFSDIDGDTIEYCAYEPSLSVGEHLNLMYQKTAKKTRGFQLLNKQLLKTLASQKQLQDYLQQLYDGNYDNVTDIMTGLAKLGIQSHDKQPKLQAVAKDVAKPSRHYRWGKSPKENDRITKSAKSNEFWFHVVQGGGTHVVVSRLKNDPKDQLPDDVIRKAAIVAIHHSKARMSQSAEVYYTQKRYLKKPKGAADGYWTVLFAKTLTIRYDRQELEQVLSEVVRG
jgi:hypothetical protein